jgi:hypothetical protein
VSLWVGDLSGEPDATDSVDILETGRPASLLVEVHRADVLAEVAIRVTWNDADGRYWSLDLHQVDRLQPVPVAGQRPRPWRLSEQRRRRKLGRG